MKTLKKIFTVLALFTSFVAFGQGHYVGIYGGVGLSNVKIDSEIDLETKFRTGVLGGISYEYQFKKLLHLEFGIEYAQQGFTYDVTFNFPDGTRENKKGIIDYDYLSVPLKAGISFGSNIQCRLNVGVIAAIPVKAESVIPVIILNESVTLDYKDEVSPFDLGGLIELGGSFEVVNNIRILATAGYRHSLTTFSNENHFNELNGRHYSLRFSLGLKYKLGKG